MLKSQKITLRMSELRESLNSQAEDAPVEEREKLLTEYQEAEKKVSDRARRRGPGRR